VIILFCDHCLKPLETCPMCKSLPLKIKNAPRIVNNMLNKLKIKCLLCNEIMERVTFIDHYNIYCLINCPLGCKNKLSRKEFKNHLEKCDKKIVSCISKYCSYSYSGTTVSIIYPFILSHPY
jgi:hypothetical protein